MNVKVQKEEIAQILFQIQKRNLNWKEGIL